MCVLKFHPRHQVSQLYSVFAASFLPRAKKGKSHCFGMLPYICSDRAIHGIADVAALAGLGSSSSEESKYIESRQWSGPSSGSVSSMHMSRSGIFSARNSSRQRPSKPFVTVWTMGCLQTCPVSFSRPAI
jgi:hypothetical protein